MSRPRFYHIVFLLSLLCACFTLYSLEKWAERNFKPISFDDAIAKRLQRENPDLICIGNSTVSINIVKPLFEKGLAELKGKPIKVSYITAGGMHTAWQFLVIKNQIVRSGLKNIPIVIVDYEDFFLRPDAKTATSGKSEIILRKLMQEDEPVFLSKIGSNSSYFTNGFPYLYSQRFQIKRKLTSIALIEFMRITSADSLVHSRRWKQKGIQAVQWLLGTVYKGSNFRSGQSTPDERIDRTAIYTRDANHFAEMVDRSFLPDILSFKDSYQLIFILSNSNPQMPLMKESIQEHSLQLEKYLKSEGAFYIDMNRVHELQVEGLMHDSRHYTKGYPRELNTRMLLRELSKLSVFDN